MPRAHARSAAMRLRYDEKYVKERERDGKRASYGSYTLTLPKALVEALGWKHGDEIAAELKGDRIMLRRDDDA